MSEQFDGMLSACLENDRGTATDASSTAAVTQCSTPGISLLADGSRAVALWPPRTGRDGRTNGSSPTDERIGTIQHGGRQRRSDLFVERNTAPPRSGFQRRNYVIIEMRDLEFRHARSIRLS